MDARRKVWNVGEGIFDCGIFCEIGNMKNGRVVGGGYGFADIGMDVANTFVEQRDI